MNEENKKSETTEPDGGQGNFLFAMRIVPARREGNTQYVRTLGSDEEDTGEAVKSEAGVRIAFEPGGMSFSINDIDNYYNPPQKGGYKLVSNTIWTWYRIITDEKDFLLFLSSFAQRTDTSHALWSSAVEAWEKASNEESGISQRHGYFNSFSMAQLAIVSISAAYRMARTLIDKWCPDLDMPNSIANTFDAIRQIRNAFEHIDERAASQKMDDLSIFQQKNFESTSEIRYKNYRLIFKEDLIQPLLDCRELIIAATKQRIKMRAIEKKVQD